MTHEIGGPPPTPGEIKRRHLKAAALDALREHGTIGHAAAAAGVSPSTIYRWRETDADFNDAVTEWMHVDQVDQLHASMYRIATNDDPKTASAAVKAGEFLLKSLDRERYGDTIKNETTITVNAQVQHVHTIRDQLREKQQERLQALRTIDAEPPTTP